MSLNDQIRKINREFPSHWNPHETAGFTKLEPKVNLEGFIEKDRSQFERVGGVEGNVMILGITAKSTQDIPGMKTPRWVYADGEVQLVVDLRGVTKIDERTRELAITNQKHYRFEKYRSGLSALFLIDPDSLDTVNPVFGRTYLRLIRDTLGRTLQLSRDDANTLNGLVATHWLSMFEHDPRDLDQDERYLQTRINRICRLANTTPELYRMYHNGESITSIEALVDIIKEKINTPKMSHLTPELFVSVTTRLNSFDPYFAYNMGVALAHPPTFIALVMNALFNTDKSVFSQLVKDTIVANRDSRGGLEDIIRLMEVRTTLTKE